MQSSIDELFQLISRPDLTEFKRRFRADLVNEARTYTLYNYDYSNTFRHPVKSFEVQHEYLIHEAIKLKSVEALKALLANGAKLLQRQHYEHTDYEITTISKVLSHKKAYVSGTALERITIFADPSLLQFTFDYICEQRLFEIDSEYIEFLAANLTKVDRRNFQVEFLKIDVGGLLPKQFNSEEAYKEYLRDLGYDISRFFFSRQQYIALFTHPQQQANAELLKHALKVCEFTVTELKALYNTVSENVKWIIYNHNSQVDPELSAQSAGEFAEKAPILTKKRSPSPDVIDPPVEKQRKSPSPKLAPPRQYPFAPHHVQEYHHLVNKRIPLLKAKIAELNQRKKSTKVSNELVVAKKSLDICLKNLEENPYYQSLKVPVADAHDNSLNP